MSFTDQQPQIATEEDVKGNWGKLFRCYLCGHKFIPGDVWRWVHATHVQHYNFITCKACDGPDVLDRWVAISKEAEQRFWWLYE